MSGKCYQFKICVILKKNDRQRYFRQRANESTLENKIRLNDACKNARVAYRRYSRCSLAVPSVKFIINTVV